MRKEHQLGEVKIQNNGTSQPSGYHTEQHGYQEYSGGTKVRVNVSQVRSLIYLGWHGEESGVLSNLCTKSHLG